MEKSHDLCLVNLIIEALVLIKDQLLRVRSLRMGLIKQNPVINVPKLKHQLQLDFARGVCLKLVVTRVRCVRLNISDLALENFNPCHQDEHNVIVFVKLKVPYPLKNWIVNHAHLVAEIVLVVKFFLHLVNICFVGHVGNLLLQVLLMMRILHVEDFRGSGVAFFINHVVIHLALKAHIVNQETVLGSGAHSFSLLVL